MPSMPRTSAKATKLAYALLGKPANVAKVRKRKPKKQMKEEQLPT
jgi:hypothetical protein